MPEIQKLLLEDALEDSPQTRCFLGVFEKDATMLMKYTTSLSSCCQRVLNAQEELSAATRGLSAHLKAYDSQKFPLETEDSTLSAMMKQFTVYLDELSSIQQIVATQLGDGMMYPINRFIQADLQEISQMSQMFNIVSREHEQSLEKYMKMNKKKENLHAKTELNNDLYEMRKKFHRTALHYFSSLNNLQYKRRISLLEPLVGFMQAQKAMHSLALEATACTEVDDFLANIHASVQSVQQELSENTQHTVEKVDNIEQQSAHLYYAEPPQDMPYIPPNTALTQKAGYLFLRSKQALITTKWERFYFFIQGGNLMCQARNELAGSLVLDLNKMDVSAGAIDVDDRRFCFQVNTAKNKVILQAEDDREKDEWISTINNVVHNGAFTKDRVKKRDSVSSDNNAPRPNSMPLSRGQEQQREPTMGAAGPVSAMRNISVDGSSFVPDAPIQFDMISPNGEAQCLQSDISPQRINPFDQSSAEMMKGNNADGAAFCRAFVVRFLGSMEVQTDRGEQLIHETIRQIMAARAIHNVFKTTESRLVVSSETMRLIDPSNNSIKTEFSLEDISFWAAHNENKRLFGFITRTRPSTNEEGSAPKFACHVFECNTSADEICHSIRTATKLAFQVLMKSSNAKPSDLGAGESSAVEEGGTDCADLNPPITEMRGDGDERRVEGAECKSDT